MFDRSSCEHGIGPRGQKNIRPHSLARNREKEKGADNSIHCDDYYKVVAEQLTVKMF
jgi:hypothetical protein